VVEHADSAGVPFEGRSFSANESADDDGRADPRLIEAVRRFRAGELGLPEIVDALRPARVLVPLVAERGDEGIGAHGQLVDKTQELSLVTVAGPDGRAVLPLFSSVEAMATWDPAARPIPVAASRVALAAAAEGTELLVLDPRSSTEIAIRRPAFRALATGESWVPCFADEAVLAAFVTATSGERSVRALQLAPGDPDARLGGPEAVVQLTLEPGLDAAELASLLDRIRTAWSRHPVIADRVDSIGIRLEALA
jgi:hypothetical protein